MSNPQNDQAMSEDKRKNLTKTLSSLSNEDKAWVINFLVQGLFSTPAANDDLVSSERRVARVVQRNISPTDAQLEEMFSGKKSPSVPEEDFSWSDLISANTGKTIKPIEKWL